MNIGLSLNKIKIPANLFQTLYTMPLWQKAAIFGVSLALPVVLFAVLFVWPLMEELQEKQNAIAKLQGEVETLEKRAQLIPVLQEENRAANEILAVAIRLLPETQDIPSILAELATLGNEARVTVLKVKPEQEQKDVFYATIPITLELQGGFHNILGLLNRIARMNRIVRIADIQMDGAKKVQDIFSQTAEGRVESQSGGQAADFSSPEGASETASLWQINAICNAMTYRFLTEAEIKTEQAKKAEEAKKKAGKK
ncbi:MAG: type 4a pilus biogenesis protein PilO [Dissulfuribacterales bacterium]